MNLAIICSKLYEIGSFVGFDMRTHKRLLTEANLTLTKAIETARSIEAAEAKASQLKGTNRVPVMNVKSTRRHQGRDTREKHGMCPRCGGRIIKQKTVATKMQGVTSVASKGTWQKCAGQSNQVAQHPQPNVFSRLITLRLQLVSLAFLFT